jgi:hypothetical protein
MKPTFQFAVTMTAFLLIAMQSYAGEWDTVITPEIRQQQKAAVNRQELTLKVWETVKLPLPGSRSYSCPVDIDGDSVGIVDHDPLESVTLRGLKPGRSIVRIYRKFWRDPDIRESYVLDGELTVTVKDESADLPGETASTGEDIPFPRQNGSLDWQGFISAQSTKLVEVISDKRAWNNLWSRAFNSPAPEVDFNKFSVACIFLGHDADWLFGINFGKPSEEGSELVIPYYLVELELKLMGTFRASGQYRMKAFEKRNGLTMIIRNTSSKGANRP